MDPRFYVVREERFRVLRHVAPPPVGPIKVLVKGPSAMSSEEHAHHFHMNMAARHQDFEEDLRRAQDFSSLRSDNTWHGEQLLPAQATRRKVNVHNYPRPPVATQGVYQQPNIAPVPHAQNQPVIDCNEAARIYGGVIIKDQAPPPPPPVKKPVPGTVMDYNEAARIYGGVVIKGAPFF